jgi:1,4-dihydroxy-2-naphthoate octaprenyltransferase
VFVLAFFGGVAVCGTAFVQLGHVPALAAWLALPVGALATAILVVNNLRDRKGDAVAGKRTLAVRLGRDGAIAEYVLLIAVAYAVPVALAIGWRAPWLALPCATAPWAIDLTLRVSRVDGMALNPLLGATAKLLLVHSVLAALGVVLAS